MSTSKLRNILCWTVAAGFLLGAAIAVSQTDERAEARKACTDAWEDSSAYQSCGGSDATISLQPGPAMACRITASCKVASTTVNNIFVGLPAGVELLCNVNGRLTMSCM